MFIDRYEAFGVHEEQEMAYCCFGTGPRINSRLPGALGGLDCGTWRISTLAELSATLPSLGPSPNGVELGASLASWRIWLI